MIAVVWATTWDHVWVRGYTVTEVVQIWEAFIATWIHSNNQTRHLPRTMCCRGPRLDSWSYHCQDLY